MNTSVLVTGASGFIAQHIVKILLSKGYNVVGTVRSAEKGENLKKNLGSAKFTYEVVSDMVPTGAFDEVLKLHPEVTVFLHTASPFHYKAANIEEELLYPAIHGTKNALSGITKYGPQIKHVVVTSSYVSMMNASKFYDPSHVNTEESWNPITWSEACKDAQSGYYGSKKFAEKAAWDFMEKEKPSFKINFVNPVLVFGPQAFDSEIRTELNTSSEMINCLLKLDCGSAVPDVASVFVDVRDVAMAHIVAFENDWCNERLILFSSNFTNQAILSIIRDKFDNLKGTLPQVDHNKGKELSEKICQIDNRKTRGLLDFDFIDLNKSVVDSVQQILRVGTGLS